MSATKSCKTKNWRRLPTLLLKCSETKSHKLHKCSSSLLPKWRKQNRAKSNRKSTMEASPARLKGCSSSAMTRKTLFQPKKKEMCRSQGKNLFLSAYRSWRTNKRTTPVWGTYKKYTHSSSVTSPSLFYPTSSPTRKPWSYGWKTSSILPSALSSLNFSRARIKINSTNMSPSKKPSSRRSSNRSSGILKTSFSSTEPWCSSMRFSLPPNNLTLNIFKTSREYQASWWHLSWCKGSTTNWSISMKTNYIMSADIWRLSLAESTVITKTIDTIINKRMSQLYPSRLTYLCRTSVPCWTSQQKSCRL